MTELKSDLMKIYISERWHQHSRMAYDVTLEFFGLDKNELVTYSVSGDLKLDELLVKAAKRCGISPITRNLFAFKQVNFSPQSFSHARLYCVRQGCHSQVIIASIRFVILDFKMLNIYMLF